MRPFLIATLLLLGSCATPYGERPMPPIPHPAAQGYYPENAAIAKKAVDDAFKDYQPPTTCAVYGSSVVC